VKLAEFKVVGMRAVSGAPDDGGEAIAPALSCRGQGGPARQDGSLSHHQLNKKRDLGQTYYVLGLKANQPVDGCSIWST
jgi:hypothetical protein